MTTIIFLLFALAGFIGGAIVSLFYELNIRGHRVPNAYCHGYLDGRDGKAPAHNMVDMVNL